MSKGGGGSSKKKKSSPPKPKPAALPSFTAYVNIPVVSTIDPFIANNQALLAQQLNAGYGGGVRAYVNDMNSYYRPAQTVGLFEPLTETIEALNGKYNTTGTTGLVSLDRVLKAGLANQPPQRTDPRTDRQTGSVRTGGRAGFGGPRSQ